MADKNKEFNIAGIKEKIKRQRENTFDFSAGNYAYPPKRRDEGDSCSWRAVSRPDKTQEDKSFETKAIADLEQKFFKIPDALKADDSLEFSGKNLEGGVYAGADLQKANFSAANLSHVDFSGANLRGADLSGSDLTDANLSNADLSGAVLSGANLLRTNFTGAKMNGVVLTEANLEDAILLDIEIDDLAIEELQALVEYMAIYYPHKLNLTRLNLTLLDLSKIDLSQVSLRGVDFTGCSMKGVKIWELDISECIISPEQIAEALGRVPTPQEMARLLAPKTPKKKQKEGIDMTDLFFDNGKEFGVWDVTHEKGIDIGKLVDAGMKLFRKSAPRPPVKDEEILAHIKEEKLRNNSEKSHNEELKEKIKQRKEEELKKRMALKNEFKNEVSRENDVKEKSDAAAKKVLDSELRERMANMFDRSRD